jgi:hypothetical protein
LRIFLESGRELRCDRNIVLMTKLNTNSTEEADEQELANIVSRLADRMQSGRGMSRSS